MIHNVFGRLQSWMKQRGWAVVWLGGMIHSTLFLREVTLCHWERTVKLSPIFAYKTLYTCRGEMWDDTLDKGGNEAYVNDKEFDFLFCPIRNHFTPKTKEHRGVKRNFRYIWLMFDHFLASTSLQMFQACRKSHELQKCWNSFLGSKSHLAS